VYFRSNRGERELPDIVLDLHGPLHIEQVGFVDSRHGGLRTRFLSLPDAPRLQVARAALSAANLVAPATAPIVLH
jgi:hypothetical protein